MANLPPYELGIETDIVLQAETARLGEGFNSLSLQRYPDTDLFAEQAPSSTVNSQAQLSFYVSESTEELATKLGVHAEVAAGYLGAKVEGAASLLNEHRIATNSVVVAISGKALHRSERFSVHPKTLDTILGWLSRPGDLLENYGDYYCSQLDYGSELVMLLVFTAATSDDKTLIMSSFKGSYSGAFDLKAQAAVESAVTKTTNKVEFTYRLHERGGFDQPENMTLKDCMEYCKAFFRKVTNETLIAATYVPWTRFMPEGDITKGNLDEVTKVKNRLRETLKPAWIRRDRFLHRLAEYHCLMDDYATAFVNGSFVDLDTKRAVDMFLPTEYYSTVKRDIEERIDQITKTMAENSGSLDLGDADKIIQECSADLPDLKLTKSEVIKGSPYYFRIKLNGRKIRQTAKWGGDGGREFTDHPNLRGALTRVEIRHDGGQKVVGSIRWYATGKDQQTFDSGLKGEARTDTETITLNKGDYITGISAVADTYLRQITFMVHRKGKNDQLEQCGPYPPSPVASGQSPQSLENKIVCGFDVRSGGCVDAIRVHYVDA